MRYCFFKKITGTNERGFTRIVDFGEGRTIVQPRASASSKFTTGFTLIETLLYFGLLAIILAIIAATITSVASDKIRLEMIQEVNQNARMVMQTITKNVNNAASISSPSDGNESDTLTLAMPDAGEDPIVIDLDNGMVRISVDGDTPVPLTTDEVSVTELVFSNITPTNGSGSVRVEMTIGSSSTSNRQEYQISETFYTAATIKSQ